VARRRTDPDDRVAHDRMTENGEVAAREAALVARIAEGDNDEALRALYRRYGRPVYGLGMRMLNDRGLAEELVQDTFVRLWRSSPRFDPGQSSVRTFVFTLARRRGHGQDPQLLRPARAAPRVGGAWSGWLSAPESMPI